MSWFSKWGRIGLIGQNPLFASSKYASKAEEAYKKNAGVGSDTITSTQTLDPYTEKYRQETLDAQRMGANTPGGLDPYTQQALGLYGNAGAVGNLGLSALGGNSQAFSQFQNPYQQQVLDSLTPFFDQARSGALNDVRNAFSSPGGGAYGGSRQGVASGVALGQIANQEAQTKAGLTYQGFNDAMGRAGQAANLGFGGAAGLAGAGPYAQTMGDPNLRKAYLLRQGFAGLPYPGTQTTQPVNQNQTANVLGWLTAIKGLNG